MSRSPRLGLWVRSDLTPDGVYVITVSADADRSWVLDRDAATAYALASVEAAQRAEFDAAVFALFTNKIKMDPETAAQVIGSDVRPDRPPLDDGATAPLTYLPGVNAAGKPFVHVHLDDEPWGQLSPAELRDHAMHVLEAPAAAALAIRNSQPTHESEYSTCQES